MSPKQDVLDFVSTVESQLDHYRDLYKIKEVRQLTASEVRTVITDMCIDTHTSLSNLPLELRQLFEQARDCADADSHAALPMRDVYQAFKAASLEFA